MFRAFNMGIGLVLACAARDASRVMDLLTHAGERPIRLGVIASGSPGVLYREPSDARSHRSFARRPCRRCGAHRERRRRPLRRRAGCHRHPPCVHAGTTRDRRSETRLRRRGPGMGAAEREDARRGYTAARHRYASDADVSGAAGRVARRVPRQRRAAQGRRRISVPAWLRRHAGIPAGARPLRRRPPR